MVDTPSETAASEQLEGLRTGALSPGMATGLAFAAFVPGVGVATIPPLVAAMAGPWGWVAVVAGALVVLCVAVAVIVFARRYVVSGALYSYVHKVFGGIPSVITAASMFIAYVLGIAFLVVLGCLYAGSFLLSVGVGWALDPWAMVLYTVVISLVGAVLAYFGVDVSARLSVTLLLVTVPLVLVITALLPFQAGFDFGAVFDFAGTPFEPSGFVAAATLAVAVMILFESSAATASETRNPKRAIPAIVAGVPIVLGVAYAGATILQAPALPLVQDQLDSGASAIYAFANLVGLGWSGSLVDLCLAVAAISAVIAFVNYGSRVAGTMAQDGVLPLSLTRVHPRFGTPTVSIGVVSVLVIVFTLAMFAVNGGDVRTTYNFNAALYALFVVVPYVLVCVGAVVVLVRERSKAWIPVAVTSLVGAAGFVWIFVGSITAPAVGAMVIVPWSFLILLVVAAVIMLAIRAASRGRIVAPTG